MDTESAATNATSVWGAPLIPVHCPSCGEAHLVSQNAVPSLCPLCLQSFVELQPALLREEPPEQVVSYDVSIADLSTILTRWTQGGRFRPAELRASVLLDRIQRYLVPLWLVDGRAEGPFRADVGYDYQVVSHQDRFNGGAGWSSQEVTETRRRWEPRAGRISRAYENVVAPALDDHTELMRRLGDYDLAARVAYSPDASHDAAVRIPTLEPEAAWAAAEPAFERAVETECRLAAGADHIRDFTLQAEYQDLNWTLLLLPAYVTWYQEEDRVWPVLINGQSGRVSGVRRASTRKANTASVAMGGVAALLFALGGLLTLMGALFPPTAILGIPLLIVSTLLGLAAPVPAISAWVANRRSSPDANG